MTPAFPERVRSASDPVSGLEGSLTIVRADDDGVSAVAVELHNPTAQPVPLEVNADPSAFLMIAVTDDDGQQLSKPPRKFATDEQQTLETVTLQPGARASWTTRLADWIALDRIPEGDGLPGRLVVNVALLTGNDRDRQSVPPCTTPRYASRGTRSTPLPDESFLCERVAAEVDLARHRALSGSHVRSPADTVCEPIHRSVCGHDVTGSNRGDDAPTIGAASEGRI